ncbi:CPXCG motif-containing cysteine-rich protein [Vibrio methylphosphonaticus]|uniref:CPXCG motif-containing cysteine-rich protein n=1 Tax=Vibrio methylphosphonaticus TaxID=2946866 RepID=UPI00202A7E11|nr:CPXCG motif-containing cysteine-rich protein [Vibrio methylphosphonaticus]MCL9774975.1 CPXCG motif-containing cysteine-rich protein [Vibrio methylphosphonaticus]
MDAIRFRYVECPYCGEQFETSIDCSSGEQQYIEDCYVCCRPILFSITFVDDDLIVSTRHENDA